MSALNNSTILINQKGGNGSAAQFSSRHPIYIGDICMEEPKNCCAGEGKKET